MKFLKKIIRILKIKYLVFKAKKRMVDLADKESIIENLEARYLNSTRFQANMTGAKLLKIADMSSAISVNRIKTQTVLMKLERELKEVINGK